MVQELQKWEVGEFETTIAGNLEIAIFKITTRTIKIISGIRILVNNKWWAKRNVKCVPKSSKGNGSLFSTKSW